MNTQPFFTIVTPSYNQGRFIKRSIESVLNQNFYPLEYLIFDGGSEDQTVEVLRSFGDAVQWISEPDKGQAHAVNRGLKAARGAVIGWLNSDDIYYPCALRTVHDFFVANPTVDILYGLGDHIDEYDNVMEPYYNEEWNYERLKEICFICQPAVFFRKSIVDKFGMLDENLRFCMDYEYWLRIGKQKSFYYLKQKLAGSRLYADTKTLGSSVGVHEEILRMFKEKIGQIPDKWILAHAHVVARARGLNKKGFVNDFRYIRTLIVVSLLDSMRLQQHISISLLKIMAKGLVAMVKNKFKSPQDKPIREKGSSPK